MVQTCLVKEWFGIGMPSSFPLRKLGTFALFELPTLQWGTYLLKWTVIYLKCKGGLNKLCLYIPEGCKELIWLTPENIFETSQNLSFSGSSPSRSRDRDRKRSSRRKRRSTSSSSDDQHRSSKDDRSSKRRRSRTPPSTSSSSRKHKKKRHWNVTKTSLKRHWNEKKLPRTFSLRSMFCPKSDCHCWHCRDNIKRLDTVASPV